VFGINAIVTHAEIGDDLELRQRVDPFGVDGARNGNGIDALRRAVRQNRLCAGGCRDNLDLAFEAFENARIDLAMGADGSFMPIFLSAPHRHAGLDPASSQPKSLG